MKKLTLALVASAVTISAASAHNIGTGFYLGVHGGYGNTSGKLSATRENAAGALVAAQGSRDVGSNTGNIGIMGGYGWVHGCFYLGGELAYTFENTKINDTMTVSAGFPGQMTLKRTGYFNAALRAGYLFTPSTMGYIRLGGNAGKWKLNDSLNGQFTGAQPGTGSKSRLSFAPGLGLETAVHRNVYLRVEYNYEFGPSVTATNGNFPGAYTKIDNIRSQSGKVGLSYKF